MIMVPGAGLSAILLCTYTRGSSAGPSKPVAPEPEPEPEPEPSELMAETESTRLCEVLCELESVTWAVKETKPGWLGAPAMLPVAPFNCSPAGRAPEAMFHV